MWWKPYEALLEAKAVPAHEVLLDLIAQELVDMCLQFPPRADEIIWFDNALREKWASRFDELPAISPAMAGILGALWRWDLRHEIEAIDHFVRNGAWRRGCGTEFHWGTVQIVWRAGLEFLYQRKDDCGGLLKRTDLERIVERFEERFARKTTGCVDG